MNPSTPIETLDQLKCYLYVAMQLEHATIPPYLTAAYTAKIEKNRAAIDVIGAVAKEEMLHLTLAANLLNAVGGKPEMTREGFSVTYPCHLPSGATDFAVSIEKFSACAIETFLNIERPARPEDCKEKAALPRDHGGIKYIAKHDLRADTRGLRRGIVPFVMADHEGHQIELHYWSIGEFYNAIRNGFTLLADRLGQQGLFVGDPSRQVNPKYYFSAGGDLTRITDLDTALAAIDLISVQGEGYTDETHGMGDELAHYYRFDQIRTGRYYEERDLPHDPQGGPFPKDYSEVFPIKKDGKIADYSADPKIQKHARLFNGRYKRFLEKVNRAFNGEPDLFAGSYTEMFRIKRDMEALIKNPLTGSGEHAAPTFEMNEFVYPSEND